MRDQGGLGRRGGGEGGDSTGGRPRTLPRRCLLLLRRLLLCARRVHLRGQRRRGRLQARNLKLLLPQRSLTRRQLRLQLQRALARRALIRFEPLNLRLQVAHQRLVLLLRARKLRRLRRNVRVDARGGLRNLTLQLLCDLIYRLHFRPGRALSSFFTVVQRR